jgi:FKBP12-rapamycin complex-associated protein
MMEIQELRKKFVNFE